MYFSNLSNVFVQNTERHLYPKMSQEYVVYELDLSITIGPPGTNCHSDCWPLFEAPAGVRIRSLCSTYGSMATLLKFEWYKCYQCYQDFSKAVSEREEVIYYFADFAPKGGTPTPFTDKIFGQKGVMDIFLLKNA